MSKFNDRLKKLLEEHDLKQKEFARKLDVSKQAVSNWVNGNRNPDNDMLVKIADFFNVTTDYLLGRTDYPEALIYEKDIEGRKIHIEYDKNEYPDGLTHEQVIDILIKLKAAGFSFSPPEEKEDDKT